MQKFLLLISFLLISIPTLACEVKVEKTLMPLDGQEYHNLLCIEDYFIKRDFANFSAEEDDHTGAIKVIKDVENIHYYDMLLFSLPNTTDAGLGEDGRLTIVKNVLELFWQNLRNENGQCQLKLFSGDLELNIKDFKMFERKEGGQPGSRLMLTKDDVPKPRWQLSCPDKSGSLQVTKSGNYFFIFVDTYENIDPTKLKNHLIQLLFSLR